MAQDLFRISLTSLRLQVPTMNLLALKQLYEKTILWKRQWADKVDDAALYDMLRKQSIVRRELARRGLVNNDDFKNWNRKLETRMGKDGRIH